MLWRGPGWALYVLVIASFPCACSDPMVANLRTPDSGPVRQLPDAAPFDGSANLDGPPAPPIGQLLGSEGAWDLRVSQDGRWLVFSDFHEVPSSTGPDVAPQAKILPVLPVDGRQGLTLSTGLVFGSGAIDWIHNVAVVVTDYSQFGQSATLTIWKEGLASPQVIVDHGFPFVRVSTDGGRVAFAASAGSGKVEVRLKAVGDSGNGDSVLGRVSVLGSCLLDGDWSGPSTLIVQSCPASGAAVVRLFRIDAAGVSPAVQITPDADNVGAFLLATGTDGFPTGALGAYVTAQGELKIVSLAGSSMPTSIEPSGIPPLGSGGGGFRHDSRSAIGAFRTLADGTSRLLYHNSTGELWQASLDGAGGVTAKVKRADGPIRAFAYASFPDVPVSADLSQVLVFRSTDFAGTYGSIDLIGATSAMRTPLGSDNNGYPGDDAFSSDGAHVLWYDQVQRGTGGIGRLHAAKVDGTSPSVLDAATFLVRSTGTLSIVAILGGTAQVPDPMGSKRGGLYKADLSSGAKSLVVDGVTTFDVVPSSPDTVVYCRREGIYLLDQFSGR